MRNSHVTIGDGGGSFDLVGVDDWSARRRPRISGYDLARAQRGRDLSRPAVLLAHQPANFEEAVAQGIGLQLSGHTHGGQFFPVTWLVPLRWPRYAGLYEHQAGKLYVSRGTGFWGPPLRLGSPPELVKVTLTA
jgi:predicted MPP superfamily phosphohydrolase